MKDLPTSAILDHAEAVYKYALADPVGAASGAHDAVATARSVADGEALVVALKAAAWSERGQLSLLTARRLLDEAARLALRHRLPERLGEVMLLRAAVLSELGRVPAADQDLRDAERLVSNERRPELVLQRATLMANVGRTKEALTLLRRVAASPSGTELVRAKALNNLAMLEARRGRCDVALMYVRRAQQEADGLGKALPAYFAQTEAWVTMQAGRLTESIALFKRAGLLYAEAALPLGEHYLDYADALQDLRLLPEALNSARLAAESFVGADLMQAEAKLQLARLLLAVGEAETARASATRAAVVFRRQGRTAWVARAAVIANEAKARQRPLTAAQLTSLRGCAQTLEDLGLVSDAVEAHFVAGRLAAAGRRPKTAIPSLLAAERLSRRAPVLVRLKGRLAAATAAELQHDGPAVLRTCGAALRDLDRHRAALPSMELRALASGHGAEVGALGLRALLPTGSPGRVFDWLERTRAAALVTVDAPPEESVADELATVRTLNAELAERRRDSGVEPAELRTRITEAEASIRRSTWSPGADGTTSYDARVGLPALRRTLGGAMLVEYGLLDDRILAVVVGPRRSRLVDLGPLDGVESDCESLLFALRRLARVGARATAVTAARQSADAVLARLRDRLIAPLALDPNGPVVVVPVGVLQRIPWAPLHTGPVTVAPSATLWVETARRTAATPGSVALIAGPDLDAATPEIEALREIYPRATVLVPPHATATTVTAALKGVDLAHLACHGRIRADNPIFSSLQLSDGPLTLHELAAGADAPHRLVLAACDSGVQVSYPGDETLGFVSALLARGTAGIVASSVLVPDADALALMRTLHQQVVRGKALSVALHAARATLDLDRPGEYVNWCAFDAYGAG